MLQDFSQRALLLLTEKYPFLTLCRYSDTEYLGIVQNSDETITTFYDLSSIQDPELKNRFLELADVWWWESARSMPINIFLRQDWMVFRCCLKTFINKDLEILHGPVTRLGEISRRSKRRSVTLVRRID